MIKSNLPVLLAKRRWTQADLARKTGIRPATINQIYHNFAERVNLEHIDRICEVLECNIGDIFEYEPNQIKKTGKNLILEEHGNRKNNVSAE